MQVEREAGLRFSGKWRTGEYRVGIYPAVRNNPGKPGLIPYTPLGGKIYRCWMSLRKISLLVG